MPPRPRTAPTAAAIAAAKADVEKYQTLLAYTRITAPFDGVITQRYADPGSLIQAGTASDTQAMPLVRLSDNYRLRLDFPVSVTLREGYSSGRPGGGAGRVARRQSPSPARFRAPRQEWTRTPGR